MNIPRTTIINWTMYGQIPFSAWDRDKLREWARQKCLGKKHSAEHVRKRTRTGSAHYRWGGDNVSQDAGRKRARKMYKTPEDKEIHHIDGNTLNNKPENIEFVTRKLHMIKDGRLERLLESKRERDARKSK